jgi:Cytidylyltransferase family
LSGEMQNATYINGQPSTGILPCRVFHCPTCVSYCSRHRLFYAAGLSSLRSQHRTVPSRWSCRIRERRAATTGLSPVSIASTERATGGLEPPTAATTNFKSTVSAGLTKRIIFGVILGGSGAAVILAGGWVFAAVCCAVVYQAAQEYYGFITSQGISKGMQPPPPVVSSLTSLLCIGITWWTFATNGTVTAALAVASFALMSLQLLAVERPRFSQLASSVFGLFYCGMLQLILISLL